MLRPDREVVQLVEFETFDPGLRGEMTNRISLVDSEDGGTEGTEIRAVHDNLPAFRSRKTERDDARALLHPFLIELSRLRDRLE
jgi:hypothetical protein